MKRLGYSAVIAGWAWAAACASDPTSVLRNGLKSLTVDPDVMFINEGDSRGLNVVPRDEQLNPVAAPVTVQSLNTSVATVAVDPGQPSTDGSNHRFVVTALAPGQVKFTINSANLTDTATISVLPLAAPVVISNASPTSGDTLVITDTSALYDLNVSSVLFGPTGAAGTVLRSTADTVVVIVPFASAGTITIDSLAVNYIPGLNLSIPSSSTVNPTGDIWGTGDTSYATAPTLPIPPSGSSYEFITNLGPANGTNCAETNGPCVIYAFTVGATTTLTFTVDWDSDADIDIYACDNTGVNGCFEDGGAGATGDQPQTFTFDFPAGTHYLVIERYVGTPLGTPPKNLYVTVEQP